MYKKQLKCDVADVAAVTVAVAVAMLICMFLGFVAILVLRIVQPLNMNEFGSVKCLLSDGEGARRSSTNVMDE
jgi:uncharacterized membrane protein